MIHWCLEDQSSNWQSLRKLPGWKWLLIGAVRPQRAAVCSAAAYESEDALGRDESQPDALRRFFFSSFFYWDVYYWIQNGSGRFVGCRGKRTADKTNQRSERDYVPLCGLAGISLCKILSSSDAHMTSVSAKPAEVCLDEKSFTTNELLVPFLQNSERNGFLKEQKGCRVTLDAAAWVQFC